MKINSIGNNLIKNPQFKSLNETNTKRYKNKPDEYKNKFEDIKVQKLMLFIVTSLIQIIYLFDTISEHLKNSTKSQKVREIAKCGVKISAISYLVVLATDLDIIGFFQKIINKVKKDNIEQSTYNNINNLNYKSDVFADFDLPTATTVNK